MAIQPSGVIALSDIQDEFGGTNPIGLSEYYRGGAYTTSNNTSVPTSGAISISDFYSATNTIEVTYELIGGGGGGAGGGNPPNNGSAGGTTTLSGSGFTTQTSSGGAGGAAYVYASTAGEASFYGAGGAAGANSNSGGQTDGGDAPSTSYGAGGGGGGSRFDGYAGSGGEAATRVSGSQNVTPGTQLTVTVGAKGVFGTGGLTDGGYGAAGYVKITVGGVATEYTTPGTYTYTVTA